jgi:hypothetical protein
LRHCVELGDTEPELDDAVSKQEVSVMDDEYSLTGTHLGRLGDADALDMAATTTRQT